VFRKLELAAVVLSVGRILPPHVRHPVLAVVPYPMEGLQLSMLPVLLAAEEVAKVKPELVTMVRFQGPTLQPHVL